MKERLTISAVVCTLNRKSHLRNCIASLLSQSRIPDEIVVVDDCSSDDMNVFSYFRHEFSELSLNLKRLLHPRVDIILLRNRSNSGVVASRNLGVMASSGDIIAFLDDDGYAHKHWLRNLLRNYQERSVIGVGGPVVETGRRIRAPARPVNRVAYITKKGVIKTHTRVRSVRHAELLPRQYVRFLQGGNMSFRREVLLKIKGGDVAFGGNFYREETDLCFRASRYGKLVFDPTVIAYHVTAKVGGCREIIRFDLNRFLYSMLKNTTYFFLKNFEFKRAVRMVYHFSRLQVQLLMKGETGLTRDYLVLKSRKKSIFYSLLGALFGIYDWLRLRNRRQDFIFSEPQVVSVFKIIATGSSFMLAEAEEKASLLRKLLGV